jgi:hypothetical protein
MLIKDLVINFSLKIKKIYKTEKLFYIHTKVKNVQTTLRSTLIFRFCSVAVTDHDSKNQKVLTKGQNEKI